VTIPKPKDASDIRISPTFPKHLSRLILVVSNTDLCMKLTIASSWDAVVPEAGVNPNGPKMRGNIARLRLLVGQDTSHRTSRYTGTCGERVLREACAEICLSHSVDTERRNVKLTMLGTMSGLRRPIATIFIIAAVFDQQQLRKSSNLATRMITGKGAILCLWSRWQYFFNPIKSATAHGSND
jgi:hypothetical protein